MWFLRNTGRRVFPKERRKEGREGGREGGKEGGREGRESFIQEKIE